MTNARDKIKSIRPSILKLGWVPDDKDKRDLKWKATMRAPQLPPAIDLANRAEWKPALDQGELGSCTAHAIAGAIQYHQIKKKVAVTDPSRLFLYYNARLREGHAKQDSGAQIRTIMKSANKDGACFEKSWPYNINVFTKRPRLACYNAGFKHRTVGYHRVNVDLISIKKALAEDFPIVGGIVLYDSVFSTSTTKSGRLVLPSIKKQPIGGHAILFVGYDDKRKVLKFRNSWGTEWGDNGYGYLPYSYVTDSRVLCDDFWTINDGVVE